MRSKARVHQILEATEEGDRTATVVMAFITILIIFSLASVIIESVSSINDQYRDLLYIGEVVTVAAFTVEYALRVWSCTEDERYARPVLGRLRYAVSLFAIIDLLAILPFYLPLVVAFDARFLRALRLVRVFRVVKIARYSGSVDLLFKVFRRQKEILLVTVALIVILIVIASCLMWHVESEVQPDKFASIPDTMWWAVATITTVGYGDVVPITPLGKFLGACIAIMGVGVVAVPAGIIVSGFIEERNAECNSTPSGTMKAEKRIELLERLARLKETGALTDEEYSKQKEMLIHQLEYKNEDPPKGS